MQFSVSLSLVKGLVIVPDGTMVRNLPASAGDAGLIPGLGRSPGGEKRQPTPVFLPGKIPWTEEPGGFIGSQRVRQLRDSTTTTKVQLKDYSFHKHLLSSC